jgi:hypothetical protein
MTAISCLSLMVGALVTAGNVTNVTLDDDLGPALLSRGQAGGKGGNHFVTEGGGSRAIDESCRRAALAAAISPKNK